MARRGRRLQAQLGTYADAEWSPHGLYVVATRRNELTALDVDKGVRWSLARHDVAWPAWTGSRTDTRIAYLAASGLRVVGGDGHGDSRRRNRGGGRAGLGAGQPLRDHVRLG